MTVTEWLGKDNIIGIEIWKKKYRKNNETFDKWLDRVCAKDESVKKLIIEHKFMFGGRVLSNRGLKDAGNLFNCFSLGYIEDDYGQILDAVKQLGMTFKAQGGQGISLSKLRPKGSPIGKLYESDGILPFMRLYNSVTAETSQGGSRKGALMISLDACHKEVLNFITVKNNDSSINKANLSLEIDDNFMNAIDTYYSTGEIVTLHEKREYSGHIVEYDIIPIEVYKAMCQNAYDWGDPACLFVNQFRNRNIMEFDKEYQIISSNPSLRAGTLVLTEKGYCKIEELENMKFKVYTINQKWEDAECFLSGKNKQLYKISLDNGNVYYCTPEHKWPVYDITTKKWVKKETSNITNEDRLIAKNPVANNLFKHTLGIISVELTDIKEDVWDIHVYDDTHTFHLIDCVTGNCGEQPLPKHGACCLSSLNLSAFVKEPYTNHSWFDEKDFIKAVRIGIRALDDIIDENANRQPLVEQRDMSLNYRNVGLGVFGYANMLMKLGFVYGSPQALAVTDAIFDNMFRTAVFESNELAKTRGTFPKYSDVVWESEIMKYHFADQEIANLKKNGLRNCSLLSIAPAGTIATVLGCSSGCEPEFSMEYTRKTESASENQPKYYKVYCNSIKEYLEVNPNEKGKKLPDYFIGANQVNWKDRVEMQGVMQTHIDTAISSTVNLPNEATLEDVEQLFLYAWKCKLKGITIFRDGCKKVGVLTTDSSDSTKKEDVKAEKAAPIKNNNETESAPSIDRKLPTIKSKQEILGRGDILETDNNVIGLKRKLVTGCGSLHCTAYFDPDTGELLETYFNKGSTGGCALFMVGLSRTISLLARAGVDIYTIVDQLGSCGVCPSYAVRSATKHDTSKGSSCPTAIGNALLDMYNEMQEKVIDNDDFDITTQITQEENSTKIKTAPPKKVEISKKSSVVRQRNSDNESEDGFKCPECGEHSLAYEGGCITCKACGWSRCG